jgi:hypothetical protein
MWHSRIVDDDMLIVAKEVALHMNWNANMMQGGTEVNHLINTYMGCNEFGPISSHLNCHLFLRVPVNWGLVETKV